jgi:hypothetical protein
VCAKMRMRVFPPETYGMMCRSETRSEENRATEGTVEMRRDFQTLNRKSLEIVSLLKSSLVGCKKTLQRLLDRLLTVKQ